MTSFAKSIFRYKLTITVGAFILILSLIQSSNVPSSNFWDFRGSDKIVHFLMYFSLSFVLFFERNRTRIWKQTDLKPKNNIWHILALIATGGIIEILQPLLSNRSCEYFDFIANTLGVLAGFFLYRMIRLILKR
ncbi:VanZ family protein [Alkaliflexus imshenetskii]|uniref:VanZ family protein n=1 Tax=Alkaliflexus imshenetskii TaxID=286730 RepID=UPI000693A252|nr:VanZ family protein [Alkaliflexus imshenetskii]